MPSPTASALSRNFATTHAARTARTTRRRDWGRALRAMKVMKDDPSRTDRVFEINVALDGGDSERIFRGMLAEPSGADLLRQAPDLPALLCDSPGLARLPDDSLGRAYLKLMTTAGFEADGLQRLAKTVAEFAEIFPGPARTWWSTRLQVVHDLMHVVTGYGQDTSGELALTAFMAGVQGWRHHTMVNSLALFMSCLAAPWRNKLRLTRYLIQAFRRGRRARVPWSFAWETVLDRPLVEIRAQLELVDFAEAHPQGAVSD